MWSNFGALFVFYWCTLAITSSVQLTALTPPQTTASSPQPSVNRTSHKQITTISTNVTVITAKATHPVTQSTKITKSIATTKRPADIYTVIDEITSAQGLSNDSLAYLVKVIKEQSNPYLPTLLSIDPRVSILLLRSVLNHTDYALQMLDGLSTYPVLAKVILRPVLSNSNITRLVLSKVFASPDLTLKLLEMFKTNPELINITTGGIFHLIDIILPFITKYPGVVHTIVADVIGNNLILVDQALKYLANQRLSVNKLLPFIMTHSEYVNPILREVLTSPVLGNYLFSKFLENKDLVENTEKLLLSGPEIFETIERFPIDPLIVEQLLGLSLQHPVSTNNIAFKILSRPGLVIKLISMSIQNNPLRDSLLGQFIIKLDHGRNQSFISTEILKALENTNIGDLLVNLTNGNVKTFKHVFMTIQGLVQNIREVPDIVSRVAQVRVAHSQDDCVVDAILAGDGLIHLEKWALKFIDASGKPERGILKGNLKFYGNYDECKEISHLIPGMHANDGGHLIEGGYCEISWTIPSSLFNKLSKSAAGIEGVSHEMRLDLCLPKSCRAQHVNYVINRTLVNIIGEGQLNVRCLEEKSIKGDIGAYIAIAVFGLLLFLCIIGTVYDVYHSFDDDNDQQFTLRDSEKNGHVGPAIALTKFTGSEEDGIVKSENEDIPAYSNINTSNSLHNSTTKSSRAQLNRFLMAFSIRENGRKILDASQPKGSMTCLNGIRVISMAWIIIGHFITTFATTLENGKEALDYIQRFTFQVLLNSPLAVDTFFVLSGVLVCYLFVKEIKKVGRIKCQHMVLYYFHRFWRLTPLYALVLLFYTCLSEYVANGPMDVPHPLYRDNCRKYWWRNILYINTLFSKNELCMRWSWYLSDDMMYYVVSPLAIIPLALGFKVLGFLVIVLMLATHIATYGYFEWYIGSGAQLTNSYRYMDEVYVKPWCRIGVYAIGLALGYIIFKTKYKYRFRRCTLMIGWLLSTSVAVTIVYITYMENNKHHSDWSVDARIAHETIYRPAWALCISWLIFTCVNGQGGFINSILSWSFWVPLSKITYGAYLLHLIILDNIVDSNRRATSYLDIFHVSFGFTGLFVFAYAFSFLFSLLIEAPSMALEKIIIKRKTT